MEIKKGIIYVGVNDHEVDLFEGQYDVPNGMAYNSYLVCGEKLAVMDAVDKSFVSQWLQNIADACPSKSPDYLVVQHMEPDHSAGVAAFMDKYPDAVVVASAKAFPMMKAFFGTDYESRRIVAAEGSTLDLGKKTLTFVMAPMVHWPEVMVTYCAEDKLLFSADGFGKFGALDIEEDWACEARRYYIGIVGKMGAQVQALLKKASALEIETICPLHGPVLEGEMLKTALEKYSIWSSYAPENEGVAICYASLYGNTAEAAKLLGEKLESRGVKVALFDLARDDMHEAFEDSFRYDRLVLACSTYYNDLFPFMRTFIHGIVSRNFQNRTVGLIENGSWAPAAAKVMKGMLEGCKDVTVLDTVVTVKSALSQESRAQIDALCEALCAK